MKNELIMNKSLSLLGKLVYQNSRKNNIFSITQNQILSYEDGQKIDNKTIQSHHNFKNDYISFIINKKNNYNLKPFPQINNFYSINHFNYNKTKKSLTISEPIGTKTIVHEAKVEKNNEDKLNSLYWKRNKILQNIINIKKFKQKNNEKKLEDNIFSIKNKNLTFVRTNNIKKEKMQQKVRHYIWNRIHFKCKKPKVINFQLKLDLTKGAYNPFFAGRKNNKYVYGPKFSSLEPKKDKSNYQYIKIKHNILRKNKSYSSVNQNNEIQSIIKRNKVNFMNKIKMTNKENINRNDSFLFEEYINQCFHEV